MISKAIAVASSSIANVKTYNSQKASLALSFLSIKSLGFFFSIILLVSVLENALPLRENTLECTSCQASIHPTVTGSLVLQRGSVWRPASWWHHGIQEPLSAHSGRVYLLVGAWFIHTQLLRCLTDQNGKSSIFTEKQSSPGGPSKLL